MSKNLKRRTYTKKHYKEKEDMQQISNQQTHISSKIKEEEMKNIIPISINRRIKNKVASEILGREQANFTNHELTIEEIAEEINQGYAVCNQFEGERKEENFIKAQMIFLDFDNWNLDEAMKNDLIMNYASIIYTTPSHNKDGKGDRFRVGFMLQEPMTDYNQYKKVMESFIHGLPEADKACKGVLRIFYGSSDGIVLTNNIKIPREKLYELVNDYESSQDEKKRKKKRRKRHSEPDIEVPKKRLMRETELEREIRRALDCIPNDCEYHIWRNCVWAICDVLGPEKTKELVMEWGENYDA